MRAIIKELPFTQAQLKQHLTYNPTTGTFTNNKTNKTYTINSKNRELRITFKQKSTKSCCLAFYYMKGHIPDAINHIDNNIHNNSFNNLKDISHLNGKPELTHELLLEVLNYNPLTGKFNWKIKFNKKENSESTTKDGYKCISVFGKSYQSHRLAWFYIHKKWPNQIDHIDHDKTNNVINNLRDITSLENNRNSSLSKRNTSGTTGICFIKQTKKWIAQINTKRNNIYLGTFINKEDAIKARKEAEERYGFHKNHGQKA